MSNVYSLQYVTRNIVIPADAENPARLRPGIGLEAEAGPMHEMSA